MGNCLTEMPSYFNFDFKDYIPNDFKPEAILRPKSEPSGAKDYKYECYEMSTYGATSSTCTKGVGEKVFGEYSVISLKSTKDDRLLTIADDVTGNSFILDIKCTISNEEEQKAQQTIEGNTSAFSIKVTSCEDVPKIYPSNENNINPLSSCVLSDDNQSIICTPTEEEMVKDQDYTIFYKQSCGDELINTGITVTYKEKVESTSTSSPDSSKSSSSVFINLANAYLLLGFFLI